METPKTLKPTVWEVSKEDKGAHLPPLLRAHPSLRVGDTFAGDQLHDRAVRRHNAILAVEAHLAAAQGHPCARAAGIHAVKVAGPDELASHHLHATT